MSGFVEISFQHEALGSIQRLPFDDFLRFAIANDGPQGSLRVKDFEAIAEPFCGIVDLYALNPSWLGGQ